MSLHDQRFPNESAAYRAKRDELLDAEIALRNQIEEVARLRRSLPLGGVAEDYKFTGTQGEISLSELFGDKETLILYSYMYGPEAEQPCPMCSAFADSLIGQTKHIEQRTALAMVARSDYGRVAELAEARGWGELNWVSAADNNYPIDYKSEMPNGAQVPMCNVFTKHEGRIHHFWTSELFFAPSDFHPRHVDMLWPLWHIFDITPEGRGDFMPGLGY